VELPAEQLAVEYLVPGSDIFRLRRILPVSLHLSSKQAPHQWTQKFQTGEATAASRCYKKYSIK